MPKGRSKKIRGKHEQKEEKPRREPDEILLELYRFYGSSLDKALWPLETARWQELVFCLATDIAGSDLPPDAVRDVVRLLSEKNLITIDVLGSFLRDKKSQVESNPIFTTIKVLLQQSGFTEDEARKAVISFCQAAQNFTLRYQGKVQLLFRKYGILMLEELTRDFAFKEIGNEDARRVFATWLQNTLNMPLPMPTPTVNIACKKLGVRYKALVDAADRSGLNVALLDDMLRTYWLEQMELAPENSKQRD